MARHTTSGYKPLTYPLVLRSGVTTRTLAGDLTMDARDSTFQRLDPDGAHRNVDLPPEEDGRVYRFMNTAGGAENLVIREDAGAVTIATLNQDEACWIICEDVAGTLTWQHMGIETIAQT